MQPGRQIRKGSDDYAEYLIGWSGRRDWLGFCTDLACMHLAASRKKGREGRG